MSSSSRFVFLTDSIVLEYIYHDASELTVLGNEWTKSTSVDSLMKLENLNDSSISFFNGDSSKIISGSVGTANVRDLSYATVSASSGKNALLDIDKLLFYNDLDPNLTSTPNLPVVFSTPPYGIIYDKIRLHLVQNFDFEGWKGFVFDVSISRSDKKMINLAKLAFLPSMTSFVLNPTPFIFAQRFFSSYFEFYVPSLYYLKRDYYLNPLTGDKPTEHMSDFIGWDRNGFLNFSFGWIEKIESINSQDYIYVFRRKIAALPERDPFESIAASVSESTNGDYVELNPTYSNDSFGNFMTDLNSVGNDYILIHEITQSEYIGNGYDKTLTGGFWTITNTLSLSQTSNFEDPVLYRPIIFNSSSAVAYKIDYVVRLYNRVDNTQVWKTASMISFDVRKYGRLLAKIDLGNNRPSLTLTNSIINSTISVDIPDSESDLSPTRDVISFAETLNIAASFTSEEPTITNDSETSLISVFDGIQKSNFSDKNNSSEIFTNGLARILIADSGNFVRFVFREFNKISSSYRLKDLSAFPSLKIRFYRKDGSFLELSEMSNTTDNKSLGEVSFEITLDVAKRLKAFEGRGFNIVYVEEKSNKESILYSGQFLLQNEFLQYKENNEIDRLKLQISEKDSQILDLSLKVDSSTSTIEDLENQVKLLSSTVDSLTSSLLEAKKKLEQNSLLESSIASTINQSVSLSSKTLKPASKDFPAESVEKKETSVTKTKSSVFSPKVKKKS